MAGIVLVCILLTVILQRLYIPGQARFYWRAVTGGWMGTALYAWVCYLMLSGDPEQKRPDTAPSAAHLLTISLAQGMILMFGVGTIYVVLVRTGLYSMDAVGLWGAWVLFLAPAIWAAAAELMLLWRAGNRRRGPTVVAVVTILVCSVLFYAAKPPEFWYRVKEEDSTDSKKYLKLTQQLMEAQPELLAQHLNAIKPHDGSINLYAITFAPYADDVFRNESGVVAQVMTQRFNAGGRVLELVNHVETAESLPWATPLNLQRAIKRFAEVMDRDKDILFIHLTSHGGRNAVLSADFWPLELEQLNPSELRQWLDDAGIRHRVISVSACYAGSWIEPLANENTLVMTAADAEHTSYGCGSKSELTYFGRAMYDEQLRNATLSFEDAHKAARKLIERREKEAGKEDGFSNPQIRVGERIREKLATFQKELAAAEGAK